MTLEEAMERHGFANVVEFNSMVASVNMTTPQNRVRLRMWQEQDGSKAGLERVILLTTLEQFVELRRGRTDSTDH